MNNNDKEKLEKLNNIFKAYLLFMMLSAAYMSITMIKSLLIDIPSVIDIVYLFQLAEMAMDMILFILYAVTFALNVTKKYHRKIALFTIRLFTIFILIDMIIYVLIFKSVDSDIILYVALYYILLIIISYAMDVIVRKIFKK